jgi:hypothetical protein
LGDEGMRRAFQYYTWRSVARQVAGIYESAVHAGAPSSLSR